MDVNTRSKRDIEREEARARSSHNVGSPETIIDLSLSDESIARQYLAIRDAKQRRRLLGRLPAGVQAIVRPVLEARRGIKRDSNGKIHFSDSEVLVNIAVLEAKLKILRDRVAAVELEIQREQSNG